MNEADEAVAVLARLRSQGAVPARSAPVASHPGPGSRAGRTVAEVERTVARPGTVFLGAHVVLASEILAGRRVGIYIEDRCPLLFFDPESRQLLRTRPNPLTHEEAVRLQRARPVGTVPRPSTEPVTVQRRVASNGVLMVAGQKVVLGRLHAGTTVSVHVSETTLAIELDDEHGDPDTRVLRRTTEQILTEPRVTSTGENITLTRNLLAAHGIHPRTTTLITRPYQQRRAYATARRLWLEVDFVSSAQALDLQTYLQEIGDPEHMLVGDTQRIEVYADQGFAIPQDMPGESPARSAVGRLDSRAGCSELSERLGDRRRHSPMG